MRWDKFIPLYNAIALKCAFSLSHSNRVRFECDKLHFIALKAHFTFIVGISIYQKRCSILGGSPDIQSFTITESQYPKLYNHNTISYHTRLSHPDEMRFQTAALLAALAIVPTCAERLKIPNERPDISPTVEGNIIAGGDGGGRDGGVGGNINIASRRSLCGQPSKKAQHSAMLAAIASFAFIGAAVLTIVSGGGGSGNEGGGG